MASADLYGEVEAICPLCKEHIFGGTLHMRKYGPDDTGLDGKRLGYIPFVRPIVVCPHCNFPIYDEKIKGDELKKCKQIVSTEEYKKYREKHCNHYSGRFLYGYVAEKLGRDELTVAQIYLAASWDEHGGLHKEDLAMGERHFRSYLAKTKEHDANWQDAQLILGELLRRQEKYDAKKHFDGLAAMKEFKNGDAAKTVALQQRLIAKKDSKEHKKSELKSEDKDKSSRNDSSKKPVSKETRQAYLRPNHPLGSRAL